MLRKPAVRQGVVAHCERSENRGSGGGVAENVDDFEAILHLIRVAIAVDFEADVPGGNWVTVGYRFLPGPRLWGVKVAGMKVVEGATAGARCVMGPEGWREERAWLGRASWGEALLGGCWEAKEPAG